MSNESLIEKLEKAKLAYAAGYGADESFNNGVQTAIEILRHHTAAQGDVVVRVANVLERFFGRSDILPDAAQAAIAVLGDSARSAEVTSEVGVAHPTSDKASEISVNAASQEMDTLEWLKTRHPEVFNEQKHLRDGAVERAYWHYGRWTALKDVRNATKPVSSVEPWAGILYRVERILKDGKESSESIFDTAEKLRADLDYHFPAKATKPVIVSLESLARKIRPGETSVGKIQAKAFLHALRELGIEVSYVD